MTRLNLTQGESSVSWITRGNRAGYWRDQLGRPSEQWGSRTAPTCSRGYPGPQTMSKYRIKFRQNEKKMGSKPWGSKPWGRKVPQRTKQKPTRIRAPEAPEACPPYKRSRSETQPIFRTLIFTLSFWLWLVRCFLDAIFGHSVGPGVSTRAGRGLSSHPFLRRRHAIASCACLSSYRL